MRRRYRSREASIAVARAHPKNAAADCADAIAAASEDARGGASATNRAHAQAAHT
jgi:hypothetical protein